MVHVALIFFLSVIGLFHTTCNASEPSTIRVATLSYAPFAFVRGDSPPQGVVMDMARAVFHHAGHPFDLKIVPYSRSILMGETGQAQAVGIVNNRTSRYLLLSKFHTANLRQVFFTRIENDWTYKGINSLDTQLVINVSSYNYTPIEPAYEDYVQNRSNVVLVTPGQDYLMKIGRILAAGRADLFNEARSSMRYALYEAGLADKVKEAGEFDADHFIYTAFSPTARGSAVRDIYDKSFEALLNDGTINSIMDNYKQYGIVR